MRIYTYKNKKRHVFHLTVATNCIFLSQMYIKSTLKHRKKITQIVSMHPSDQESLLISSRNVILCKKHDIFDHTTLKEYTHYPPFHQFSLAANGVPLISQLCKQIYMCTFISFLDASNLYKRVCPSVRRSVRPSVTHELKSCKRAVFDQNYYQYERERILCLVCVSY